MKRLFLILCLITICGTSYADIASTGYVDSVVNSLPTVAKTGSYNDLSNKPTIPNIPTGPSGGRYNLVWNGNTGKFVFELVPHSQCPSGTYDIGFAQCVDPATGGGDYGYYSHDGNDKYNETKYGLSAGEWAVEFSSYGVVKGTALCSSTAGEYATAGTPDESGSGDTRYCWCKTTSPAASRWVFGHDYGGVSPCVGSCGSDCAYRVKRNSDFRSGVFSSVG